MLGSLLMIGLLVLAVVVVWRLLRGGARAGPMQRQVEPVYQAPGGGVPVLGTNRLYESTASGARPGSVAALTEGQSGPTAAATLPPPNIPADFDVEGFLRNAKVYFLRLQAAWDARDLADIREFTTPEVFAEIKMQIDERKGETDRTEVVDLDAQLLGVDESPDGYLASVRFTGRIREAANAPLEAFEEVWNFWKPKAGRSGWVLGGIQQLH
jgi:predicted lipid-binding transport protein (Tim44 family)